MFEEYEDMFCEPSQAEEIIDKAVSDFKALLTDRVMELIKDAAEAEEKLGQMNSEIMSKKFKLSRIEKDIQDAEKRAEESEKFIIPRIYIQRFVRDAIGDYAPGDTVFVIEDKGGRSTCPVCNGGKKIRIDIGGSTHEISCPECGGYGRVHVKKLAVSEKKITDIYLKLCFQEDRVGYWNMENIYLDEHEYCAKLNNIFKTREDAEVALEGMNGGTENA